MAEVSIRRSATRERLIEAATAVFADKGVVGASVEEICERAGFTRGAFYSNFDNKDALCMAILGHLGQVHLVGVEETLSHLGLNLGGITPDELIDKAIALFLGSQSDDREANLAMVELRLYAVRTDSIRATYREFVDRVTGRFAGILEAAAAEVGLRLTVPADQMLSVLQAVFEQGAMDAILQGRPLDSPERVRMLSGVLRSMLVPA